MGRANVVALFGWLPISATLVVPFLWVHGSQALIDGFDWLAQFPHFLVALFGGIVTHEVLHGLAWKLAAGKPWSAIRFGIQWKTITPYAHCSEPMAARAYAIGAATPGIVLGLLPLLISYFMGNGVLAAFGAFFLFAAGGDALILWLLRDVKPDRQVIDHPERAGCLLLEE